jgi:hypothetical protein
VRSERWPVVAPVQCLYGVKCEKYVCLAGRLCQGWRAQIASQPARFLGCVWYASEAHGGLCNLRLLHIPSVPKCVNTVIVLRIHQAQCGSVCCMACAGSRAWLVWCMPHVWIATHVRLHMCTAALPTCVSIGFWDVLAAQCLVLVFVLVLVVRLRIQVGCVVVQHAGHAHPS